MASILMWRSSSGQPRDLRPPRLTHLTLLLPHMRGPSGVQDAWADLCMMTGDSAHRDAGATASKASSTSQFHTQPHLGLDPLLGAAGSARLGGPQLPGREKFDLALLFALGMLCEDWEVRNFLEEERATWPCRLPWGCFVKTLISNPGRVRHSKRTLSDDDVADEDLDFEQS